MLDPRFVFLGAALTMAGGIKYLIETLKGRVKPNRVTFFMWALGPLVAFAAQVHEGVGLVSLMTFIVGFNPLLIFIASFINKKSYWKLTAFDFWCGGLSLLGLILWAITQEGIFAIIFGITADGLAAIPTVVKSYKEPETENHWIFLLSAINAVITLLTIDKWDFTHWGFPVYIFGICTLLFVLIRFKPGTRLATNS